MKNFVASKRNIGVLALVAITALSMTGTVWALTSVPTASSGNITVTPEAGFIFTAATLTGSTCNVPSGGLTASCNTSGLSLPGGNSINLVLTVENTAQIAQSVPAPVVTFSSSGTSTSIYLTITNDNSYPLSVNAGSTASLTYTITGSTANQGTDSFTLSP